jgi:ATP-binding cassette subfamily B protein
VVLTVFGVMLYFSLWMALVVVAGVVIMVLVTKKIGGNSAGYFIKQQKAIGRLEGYVQEMMSGQKVVKVFCHEKKSQEDFNKVNEALFGETYRANKYANMLMPLLNNIGNVLYVLVAMTGGLLLLYKVPNVSLSGMAIGISIVVLVLFLFLGAQSRRQMHRRFLKHSSPKSGGNQHVSS